VVKSNFGLGCAAALTRANETLGDANKQISQQASQLASTLGETNTLLEQYGALQTYSLGHSLTSWPRRKMAESKSMLGELEQSQTEKLALEERVRELKVEVEKQRIEMESIKASAEVVDAQQVREEKYLSNGKGY